MPMVGGIADPDYDWPSLPEKTPEEVALEIERQKKIEEDFAKSRKELLDNPMKVDLGKKDVLFVEYFGKYYLLDKSLSTYNGRLLLKNEIKYLSGLIFDDKGVIIKSRTHYNTFIQDIVNRKGSVLLMKYVEDLTHLTPVEAHTVLKQHKASVLRFTTVQAQFKEYVNSLPK